MATNRNFIGGVSAILLVFLISSSSASGQKNCKWEVLPEFQPKFAKKAKKNIEAADEPTSIEKIHFVNEKRGFVTGTNFVADTADGGKTWTVGRLAQASKIAAMSKTSGYIFAIGNNNLVLRRSTTDCVD